MKVQEADILAVIRELEAPKAINKVNYSSQSVATLDIDPVKLEESIKKKLNYINLLDGHVSEKELSDIKESLKKSLLEIKEINKLLNEKETGKKIV